MDLRTLGAHRDWKALCELLACCLLMVDEASDLTNEPGDLIEAQFFIGNKLHRMAAAYHSDYLLCSELTSMFFFFLAGAVMIRYTDTLL